MSCFDRLSSVFAGAVIVTSIVALLGHSWWLFDLFSHFRIQYLALSLLAIAVFAIRGRWRGVVAMLPFFLLNAIAVEAARTTAESTTGLRATFSILNVNVNAANSAYAEVLDLIVAESPDLAVLVEIDDSWLSALAGLDETYPYRLEQPQSDNFGIGLISRLPLHDAAIRDLLGTPAVSAHIDLSGQRLRIIGTHLRPPTSARWSRARDLQLAELGRWIGAEPGPTIVVGDFNTTIYSPIFSAWLDEHGLYTPARATRSTISWPTFLPSLGILIDHYVVTDEIVIDEFIRGPAIGSDHYPLMATMSLRGSE